jgi:WS/DGAT/MGAT family acyltransferase
MAMPGGIPMKEPMSKVDTAWLRMESPTNLMMITGVLMLEQPLDLARFKKLLAERWLSFRRFRQKAVTTAAGAHWEYDEDFDLDWHVRLTALPGKAGKRELQQLVSMLASSPLDHSKPLWQFHVVDRYDGGSAIISRIHHCYADGLALVQVLLTLTDTEPKPNRRAPLAESWLREDKGRVLDRLLEPAKAGLSKALHVGERAIAEVLRMANHPEIAQRIVLEGTLIAQELAHALLLPDDPPTCFKGPLGVTKRVAWMEPFRLDEVKAVGRGLGCTVNDVLLASCAGALRSYLIDHGEDVDGLTIRATVPVSLRPLEHAKKLGNHFGLVFLDLPIGEPNPLRRLERVAANMRELKRSRQAIMSFGVLAALGLGPHAIQQPALEMLSRKATAVATNVPGPQQPLYLAGDRITEMMFWVPQSGSIGMGISILSYDGDVHFGLIVDSKRVPDPDDVIRRFRPEFEKLLLITLMEDWDAPIESPDAMATLLRFVGGEQAVATPAPERTGAAAPKGRRHTRSRSPDHEAIGTPEPAASVELAMAEVLAAPDAAVAGSETSIPLGAATPTGRSATAKRPPKGRAKPALPAPSAALPDGRAGKSSKRPRPNGPDAGKTRRPMRPAAAPASDFASAVAAFRGQRAKR